MPQIAPSALASVVILLLAACQTPSSATAFVGVDVIPMDRERVLQDQTVIVQDGKITRIGPSDEVELPAGTQRIEGEGRYLLPGFCDMHDHLPKPEDPILPADHIVLQLAGGVTTLRSMRGHPTQFTLRDRVHSGEIPGPRLVLASPGIAQEDNPSPEQARQLVRDYVEAGYDMIKVTGGFSPLAYRAIMAEAKTLGIKVGGHLSSAIPVPMAIELQ